VVHSPVVSWTISGLFGLAGVGRSSCALQPVLTANDATKSQRIGWNDREQNVTE
jgi:hypothetical protein